MLIQLKEKVNLAVNKKTMYGMSRIFYQIAMI